MIAATLLLSLVAHTTATASPGRALFWEARRGSSAPDYRTQSTTFSEVHSLLTRETSPLVVFCSEDSSSSSDFFSTPPFSASATGAKRAVVLPNVYPSREGPTAEMCAQAQDALSAKMTSAEELLNSLQSSVSTSGNVMVPMGAEGSSEVYEQLLAKLHQQDALIVALQGAGVTAPSAKGHYSRLLQDNQADNYNPEGTEFTIYYQNTYLYLTPDLFTGLMTFLFAAFVLLTGFSCLNQIQGPSTFVHVMPTLGKEG